MANGKDTLTTNDIDNLAKSKAELDKLVAGVKALDAKSDLYKNLVATVGKKESALKKFLADGKKKVGALARTDKEYLGLRKDVTDLIASAKKTTNAIIAARGNPLTASHVDELKRMRGLLERFLGECRKKGPQVAKSFIDAMAPYPKWKEKIAWCEANVGKVSQAHKDYQTLKAHMKKFVLAGQKITSASDESVQKQLTKPWQVSCPSAVWDAAKKLKCESLRRVMAEFKTKGLKADGLKQVRGEVYEVICSASENDRWVGIGSLKTKSFAFLAHYENSDEGKVLKAGKAVSGY
jgi:hypothetical protein